MLYGGCGRVKDATIVWRQRFVQARLMQGVSRHDLANELGRTLAKSFSAAYIRSIEKNLTGISINDKTFHIHTSRLKIIGYLLGYRPEFFTLPVEADFSEPFFICRNLDTLPACVKCFVPTELMCDTCDNSICTVCAWSFNEQSEHKGDYCPACSKVIHKKLNKKL